MLQTSASTHRPGGAMAPAAYGVPKTFVLLALAWLLDFPSERAGADLNIQAFFAGLYLLSLTLFVAGERDTDKRIAGLLPFMALGAIYLVVTVTVGLLNNQPTYAVLRNALTVFVYFSATYVTARVVMTSEPSRLRPVLAWICLAYVVANLLMANLRSGGLDFLQVRYQIIGVSANAALGYIVLTLIFRLSRAEWISMIVNGIIILLSITRSYLLVVLAQFLVLTGLLHKTFSPRIIGFGMLALGALAGAGIFAQAQLFRWQSRLFGLGSKNTESWTLQTRLSEWNFMYDEWTGSLSQFFLGSGIAAETRYFLPAELGGAAEYMIGFGHNQHLSMLFTGGILVGLPLMIMQFRQGLKGWRFVRQAIRYPHLRDDAVFLGAWGGVTVIGCLAISFVDPIFSYRGDALWYGIGAGLLLGAAARFDPANAPRRPPLPTPPLRDAPR